MRWHLAFATLRRHPLRTTLAVAGLAIAAALLLDMVMLATGMTRSFRSLLTARGYELRVAPKGTLPFDSEATVGGAGELVATLRADPRIDAVSPTYGTTLQVRGDSAPSVSTFALGVEADVQGDYTLRAGRDVPPLVQGTASASLIDTGAAPVVATGDARGPAIPIVVNASLLTRLAAAIGDTVELSLGQDAQLRTTRRTQRAYIVGEARFLYVPPELPALATRLDAVRDLAGAGAADRISMAMASVRPGADADSVRDWIAERFPRVAAISTATAIRAVEERLAYFRQLALILGSISLGIGVLLVTTLVSLSVQERIGELAVLRAIGVGRGGIVRLVMLEGLMLGVAGIAGGLALGVITARWLNTILRDFPGLPADLDFFVWSGDAATRALGMLLVASVVAGAWPAWRAGSVRVADALRREAVG